MEGEGPLISKKLKRKIKNTAKRVAKEGAKAGVVAAATAVAGPVGGVVAGFALQRLKKRPGGVMPPAVRQFVHDHGDEKIEMVELTRTPLDVTSRAPLNMVTLGQFDKAVKEAGYDSAFHLAMIVNGKYQIEKMEVIKAGSVNKKKNTETLALREQSSKTIREMFESAEAIMGKDKFTGYDARSNNCQDFIMAMLGGADIATDRAQEFVKQDVKEIFKKLPGFTSKLARGVTDMAAAANAAVYGQGKSLLAADEVEDADELEGGCEDCMQGAGVKKLYKKSKKKAKGVAKDAVEYVKSGEAQEDATWIGTKVRKSVGTGFEWTWDTAKPIRVVLRKGADILANQLNKTNIDALEKAGANIHRYVHADQATLARMIGKQIRVASKGAIITGKVTSVVGNVMIIAGTVTGQPELVAMGVAVDEAGTAIELAGNVTMAASAGVEASILGDRRAALMAFLKAAEVGGRGVLDMMTGGVGTVFLDLTIAAATNDPELATQAAARGALVALGHVAPGGEEGVAIGKATTNIIGETDATDAAGTAIAGNGLRRVRATKRGKGDDYSDVIHHKDMSDVKRARTNVAAMRDVRLNPTGVGSAWSEVKHAQVKQVPGMRKSDFYTRPTVRGFGANYVRTGYRDAPTGADATGDTRSRSKSVNALPKPNYRATGFDGSLNTILENSFHFHEINKDERLTNLDEPVTRIVRARTHVRAPK